MVAEQMGIPGAISRPAQRFFSLAVDVKFNRGRRSEYIVASCLYLQCRYANSDKMLIDFSERLAVGSTFHIPSFKDSEIDIDLDQRI